MNRVKVILHYSLYQIQDVIGNEQMKWFWASVIFFKSSLHLNGRDILLLLNIFVKGQKIGGCELLPWQPTHLHDIIPPKPPLSITALTSPRTDLRSHTCSTGSRRQIWISLFQGISHLRERDNNMPCCLVHWRTPRWVTGYGALNPSR